MSRNGAASPVPDRGRWSQVVVALALTVTLTALLPGGAMAAKKRPMRDVLVVSNNWAGTADLVDPRSFKRLARLNVIPDARRRLAEINADATRKAVFDGIRTPGRRGQQPVRRRRLRLPRRALRVLLTAELRGCGRDSHRLAQAGVAREGRRVPRRPHGPLPGRQATAGLGLDRARDRRDRHPQAADRGAHPLGRLPAREQLLARRSADLPRQHRHGLLGHRRSLAGRDQGRAHLPGHRRALAA